VRELDVELRARYEHRQDAFPSPPSLTADFEPPAGAFVVVTQDGVPAACGGLRRLDRRTAEVKRMYVRPDARGSGLGRQVLRALESAAREAGYRAIRLETGIRQPEALGLYEAEGYSRIECYREFECNALSVCFEKVLVPGATE